MPRPAESPDVRASKTLAYILRHGAEKEGLHMRSDGFVRLADVLARPKMREVDKTMVLRLVAENAKQRFELFYGYDPSPPPPKKGKKGQGGGGKKGQSGKNAKAQSSAPAPVPIDVVDQPGQAVDAAQVEDLAHEVAKSTLTEDSPSLATPTEPMEMPLVSLPVPEGDDADNEAGREGEYFIRATQGHSLNLDSVAHLEEVRDDEEGRAKTGEMVHGTKWEIWETLKTTGLSRMSRQHVHLAPALSDHRITPRPTSTLLIYLDLSKLLAGGIPVYVSTNGVVLTPGNEAGVVSKDYWMKAERVYGSLGKGGKRVVVWENGQEVGQAVASVTEEPLGSS